MTSYNGQSITYDEIGNPLTYRDGMTMTWTGRQLTTLTQNGKQNTYKYDVDGLRLEKTAGGVTTQYQYVNGQLLGEKRSNGVILRYTYDALGALSGIQYKNAAGVTTNYIVRCTLSGDVDQIFSTSGKLVARYIYDTWGNTLSVTDASGKAITDPLHIANINPIRYRGYYYDAETGLYYLQSRYYDTVTKRYINPDGYVFTGQDMQSGNMFAYCGNQPVNRLDTSGNMYVVESGDQHLSKAEAKKTLEKYQKKWRLQSDIENFNINNTSEEVVLKSTYFSAYKGHYVIRIDGDRSASIGVMLITRDTNMRDNPQDYVRHEYGHTKQLERLGIINYLLCIGIPSMFEWGTGSYYDKPFEITADKFGGVESRIHSRDKIYAGFDYLEKSAKYSIFAWGDIS